MKEPGTGDLSWAEDDGHEHRLEEQQAKIERDRGKHQATLTYGGEDNEVHRQEKGNSFECNVAGTGGTAASGCKELKCAVRQKQSNERKQDAAAVKAPGQQYARQEDGVIVKVDDRSRE